MIIILSTIRLNYLFHQIKDCHGCRSPTGPRWLLSKIILITWHRCNPNSCNHGSVCIRLPARAYLHHLHFPDRTRIFQSIAETVGRLTGGPDLHCRNARLAQILSVTCEIPDRWYSRQQSAGWAAEMNSPPIKRLNFFDKVSFTIYEMSKRGASENFSESLSEGIFPPFKSYPSNPIECDKTDSPAFSPANPKIESCDPGEAWFSNQFATNNNEQLINETARRMLENRRLTAMNWRSLIKYLKSSPVIKTWIRVAQTTNTNRESLWHGKKTFLLIESSTRTYEVYLWSWTLNSAIANSTFGTGCLLVSDPHTNSNKSRLWDKIYASNDQLSFPLSLSLQTKTRKKCSKFLPLFALEQGRTKT